MTTRINPWLAAVCILAIVLSGDTTWAAGRGGGGSRGGGGGMRGGGGGMSRGGGGYSGGSSYRGGGSSGVSRPSYSGNGSIRYSSPSSSYSRPSTPSYSRPSTPSYSRPTTPSYSRPNAPSATQRPAGGYGGSYSNPSYRPSSPGVAQRPATPSGSYISRAEPRPGNSGSLINSGTITTPGGSTIGYARGPGGGGAVGVKGADGGTAGAIRGPGGGGVAKAEGPGGGTAGAVRGPGGGGAAVAKGPGGGTAGAVRGPGGGAAAGVVGPGGGAAGAVRGPGGAAAAGVRGPGGAAAGAVRGPGGYGAAGVRGPYGGRYVTNLPGGALHYPWRGGDYWHVGFGWYSPCWVGDSMYYGWAYPPVGYYYPSLPAEYNTTVINNTTYYESEGVYYQEGEQEGKKGYVVAEAPVPPDSAPAAAEAEKGENPFAVLKGMCDYLSGLEKFGAVVQTTSDEVTAYGSKVQVSGRRVVSVSRPDKCAFEGTGDKGSRRCVYDGKTFSLFDRTKNVYTVVKVPGTIDTALDTLAKDYGIVVPLEDLLYKDLYKRLETKISAGQYLGLHTVGSATCHHLAFTTDAADAEIWVEAGDQPLLRKIAIDYRQDAIRSRFSADIAEWNTSPTFNAETFEFKLPDDVKRIEMPPKGKDQAQ